MRTMTENEELNVQLDANSTARVFLKGAMLTLGSIQLPQLGIGLPPRFSPPDVVSDGHHTSQQSSDYASCPLSVCLDPKHWSVTDACEFRMPNRVA